MRLKASLHPWPRSVAEARRIQARLPAPPMTPFPENRRLRFVLGLDCAFPAGRARAAAVLWDVAKQAPALLRCEERETCFPYVPGLLAFRELPLLLPLLAAVDREGDAVLVDGQGIAHPSGIGLAAHLALWLEDPVPVVGVGKTRLVGEFGALPEEKGACVPLRHAGRQVGWVLRSRRACRPLFVSPGGHVDLAGCLRIVSASLTRYRLPEPLRLADRLSRRGD